MAKYIITENTTIDFHGKHYTADQFAIEYCGGDITKAIPAMQVLVNKGQAKIYERKTKEQKVFEKVDREETWSEKADTHDMLEEGIKDFRAQQKRENKALYKQVEFDFPNILTAQMFQQTMVKELRLQETEISLRGAAVVVVFRNVTDSELNFMNRTYKTDKVVASAVNVVDTAARRTTDATHYAATKVIAPVVQVGARAGASIFKTILTTGAKVAGSLVTATTQGVKNAAHEIKHDPDVLRAGRELIDVKDAALRTTRNMGSGTGAARIID